MEFGLVDLPCSDHNRRYFGKSSLLLDKHTQDFIAAKMFSLPRYLDTSQHKWHPATDSCHREFTSRESMDAVNIAACASSAVPSCIDTICSNQLELPGSPLFEPPQAQPKFGKCGLCKHGSVLMATNGIYSRFTIECQRSQPPGIQPCSTCQGHSHFKIVTSK